MSRRHCPHISGFKEVHVTGWQPQCPSGHPHDTSCHTEDVSVECTAALPPCGLMTKFCHIADIDSKAGTSRLTFAFIKPGYVFLSHEEMPADSTRWRSWQACAGCWKRSTGANRGWGQRPISPWVPGTGGIPAELCPGEGWAEAAQQSRASQKPCTWDSAFRVMTSSSWSSSLQAYAMLMAVSCLSPVRTQICRPAWRSLVMVSGTPSCRRSSIPVAPGQTHSGVGEPSTHMPPDPEVCEWHTPTQTRGWPGPHPGASEVCLSGKHYDDSLRTVGDTFSLLTS